MDLAGIRTNCVAVGCLGLVSVQFGGCVAWLLIDRPATKEVYPYPLTAILTCGVSNLSLVLSLLYNMLLIILCTYYAFKTRKIPENFNEAKYIGFTMYSTCIVWLAFVPIYFGTNNDYKVIKFIFSATLEHNTNIPPANIYFAITRSKQPHCACVSTSARRWLSDVYLHPKST